MGLQPINFVDSWLPIASSGHVISVSDTPLCRLDEDALDAVRDHGDVCFPMFALFIAYRASNPMLVTEARPYWAYNLEDAFERHSRLKRLTAVLVATCGEA